MSGAGVRRITVASDDIDVRLDRWFARHFPQVTHGRLEKLLRTGQVRVDGRRAKAGLRLAAGQEVRVPPGVDDEPATPGPARAEPRAADVALIQDRVIHRDDDLVVIDKPAGLAVQGGSRQSRHIDGLLSVFGDEARLVHRLDKDTSGVLVVARTVPAARWLTAAFRSGGVAKEYRAVVVGVPKPSAGEIGAPLAKTGAGGGERMAPDAAGKAAKTRYRVLDAAGRQAAVLALEPLTGRTHQLRVHCAQLGTPILGDGKYGGKAAFLPGLEAAKRLHLHARRIQFARPDGRKLEFAAPLPEHIRATATALGLATG